MGATTSIIIGILAVGGAFLAYNLTNSYIVMILAVIIVVLICKALQPVVLLLWDKFRKKYFPLPELHEFKRQGLDPTEDYVIPPQMQGLRVLAMTEEVPLKKNKTVYETMVQESLDALSEEFPLFKIRLAAVYKRGLPIQYVASLCDKEGELMPKCLKAWLKSWAVRDMKARVQNKDLFLHDGEVAVPGRGNQMVQYTVMVLFDGELPVTVPKAEGEPADETPETEKPKKKREKSEKKSKRKNP